jgi:hypothetical protein
MKSQPRLRCKTRWQKTLEFCGGKVPIYLYIFRGGGEKGEKKGLLFDS